MDLREFVDLLRRYAVLIALVTVLGTAGAGFASYATPSTYQSTTRLFVSTPNAAKSVATEFSSGVLAGQRIATYAQLVSSPAVTVPVARSLGDPALADRIGGEISATNPTGTLLIDVTVKDQSAARAQQIAAAVGAKLQRAIRHIEAGSPRGQAPVTVTVVRPADFDAVPVAPNHRLDVALGAILGVVVGVGAALFANALGTTVRSTRDVAAVAVPVLAVIRDGGRRLGRGSGQSRPDIDAYVHLRTSLQAHGPVRPCSVVVTGTTGGEGTTSTVAHLGRAFARAGARTLVVDANWRRPGLAAAVHKRPAFGLTDVLTGGVGLTAAVVAVEPNLALLTCGAPVAIPSEMLGGVAMARLVHDATATFDVVLVDCPAVLAGADARVVAAVVDSTVVVLRARRTKRDDVAQAAQLLRQVGARLTGLVVSSDRPLRPARFPDSAAQPGATPPGPAPAQHAAARNATRTIADGWSTSVPVPSRRSASGPTPRRLRRPDAREGLD